MTGKDIVFGSTSYSAVFCADKRGTQDFKQEWRGKSIDGVITSGFLVKFLDVFGVTIERLRADAVPGVDHTFGGLRPTGVGDVRVDVGLERVFVRRERFPKRGGLLVHELDLHDGFDALVP